jgi:type VI protein secretion system component Hcp
MSTENQSRAPSFNETKDKITDAELNKVTGGKAHIHDMSFTKTVDASSPVQMQ